MISLSRIKDLRDQTPISFIISLNYPVFIVQITVSGQITKKKNDKALTI